MTEIAAPAPAARLAPQTPLAAKLLAVPAVLAVLLLGVWFLSSIVAGSYWTSIGLGAGWFVVVSLALGRLTKRRPDLRRWTRATFLLAAAAAVFGFYWTSIRETTVDEDIVTGVPASQMPAARPSAPAQPPPRNVQVATGEVTAVGHSASGRASVVELAEGGRRLTLSDFDIDPGPQVVVRLVAGGDLGSDDHVELGDLKGSKGNQQYTIPASTNIRRYDTVVFWCVPFTQALAEAKLRPS
jgi:hypothetical protein